MISLTKIDGRELIINADEIEIIESTHDTTITLKSGKKIIVQESGSQIIERVVAYRQQCFTKLFEAPLINRQ